jgi:hypothetical protein
MIYRNVRYQPIQVISPDGRSFLVGPGELTPELPDSYQVTYFGYLSPVITESVRPSPTVRFLADDRELISSGNTFSNELYEEVKDDVSPDTVQLLTEVKRGRGRPKKTV